VGGSDKLDAGLHDSRDVAPIECLGSVQPRERVVYQHVPVKAVALQNYWARRRAVGGVLVVRAAVIELASETAARTFFESSVQQWKQCVGQTAIITKEDRVHVMWNVKLGDVAASNSLVTATNSWWDDQPKPAFPDGRALGIAANVVVDVNVSMDRDDGPPGQVGDRATKVADEMLRKVVTTY
jgi:PknH-like extracellular domain